MSDPLATFRRLCRTPADAVRWSCVLEATAPKAGNVFPGMFFDDLDHGDFVIAAEIAAQAFSFTGDAISERLLRAVTRTTEVTKTNPNLGILLLLGPLVGADETAIPRDSTDGWLEAIALFLNSLTPDDGQNYFRAIAQSRAGGLGTVDDMDVQGEQDGPIDLLAAMRSAQDRDAIARQYADGFRDLLGRVVPLVNASVAERGDVLTGIADAHLRLLADQPDTLIARKNGTNVAEEVQSRASQLLRSDPQQVAQFDASLREVGHRLNPGTTADLIAGALYVLLRTPT